MDTPTAENMQLSRAIESVMDGKVNCKRLVVRLITRYPEVFNALYDHDEQFYLGILHDGIDGMPRGKVSAIKKHRELNGSGLKEAKDVIDAIALKYGWCL